MQREVTRSNGQPGRSERAGSFFDVVNGLYNSLSRGGTAIDDFVTLNGRRSTLTPLERETIGLIVSHFSECRVCQLNHVAIARGLGLRDDQILELRCGGASFDARLKALAELTTEVVDKRGRVAERTMHAFFARGYTEANLIDVIMAIGTIAIRDAVAIATDVGSAAARDYTFGCA